MIHRGHIALGSRPSPGSRHRGRSWRHRRRHRRCAGLSRPPGLRTWASAPARGGSSTTASKRLQLQRRERQFEQVALFGGDGLETRRVARRRGQRRQRLAVLLHGMDFGRVAPAARRKCPGRRTDRRCFWRLWSTPAHAPAAPASPSRVACRKGMRRQRHRGAGKGDHRAAASFQHHLIVERRCGRCRCRQRLWRASAVKRRGQLALASGRRDRARCRFRWHAASAFSPSFRIGARRSRKVCGQRRTAPASAPGIRCMSTMAWLVRGMKADLHPPLLLLDLEHGAAAGISRRQQRLVHRHIAQARRAPAPSPRSALVGAIVVRRQILQGAAAADAEMPAERHAFCAAIRNSLLPSPP